MENRKAFKLKKVIRIYNLYQIVGCTFFLLAFPMTGFSYKLGWQCEAAPTGTTPISEDMLSLYNLIWLFVIFRASEFFETLVFVLRKKQNQVSFLHLYHHIAVVSLLWLFLKYNCGKTGVFGALINSGTHLLMYTYYFLSSFGKFRRMTTTIKPAITIVQIMQLALLLVHYMRMIFACNVTYMYHIQSLNVSLILFLFVKFYAKNFIRTKKLIQKSS